MDRRRKKKEKEEKKKLLEKVLRAVGLVLVKSSKEHTERSWSPAGELLCVRTLRCIRAEDGGKKKKRDASSVHFIDKDSGDLSWRYFGGAWYFEDEAEIVEKLGEAREFMWLDDGKLADISVEAFGTDALRWKNPLFGCKCLEEMAVRADLL